MTDGYGLLQGRDTTSPLQVRASSQLAAPLPNYPEAPTFRQTRHSNYSTTPVKRDPHAEPGSSAGRIASRRSRAQSPWTIWLATARNALTSAREPSDDARRDAIAITEWSQLTPSRQELIFNYKRAFESFIGGHEGSRSCRCGAPPRAPADPPHLPTPSSPEGSQPARSLDEGRPRLSSIAKHRPDWTINQTVSDLAPFGSASSQENVG